MEICQHCGMYMKPFIGKGQAECEFCGELIAKVQEVEGKKRWVKAEKIIK